MPKLFDTLLALLEFLKEHVGNIPDDNKSCRITQRANVRPVCVENGLFTLVNEQLSGDM